VAHASQTISFPVIATAVAASTLSLEATASSGLPVTFTSTTPTVCTVSGTTATLNAFGFCSVFAHQGGNGTYSAAPTVAREFGVAHAVQTITFQPMGTQLAATTVNLVATSASGLPVSFSSNTPGVCTVSGTTATLIWSGFCGIEGSVAGNGEYRAATASQQFGVAHAPQHITFQPFGDSLGNCKIGTTVPLVATASSGLPVGFNPWFNPGCSVSGSNLTITSAGYCNIEAVQDGNGEYNAAGPMFQACYGAN
jgi:hypothetical protein